MFADKKRQKALGLRKPDSSRNRTYNSTQIKDLEAKIGAVIPDDYRMFLAEHEGWWINAEFDVDPRCPGGSVQLIEKFYGISGDAEDDNDLWNNYQTYSDRLSSKLLPIGHDAMGNEIVLSLRNKDYGTVNFLDRSEEESTSARMSKDRGLYRCANTFTGFFESLRPANIEEEENEQEIRGKEDPEAAKIRLRLLSGKLSFEEQKQLFKRLDQIAKGQEE